MRLLVVAACAGCSFAPGAYRESVASDDALADGAGSDDAQFTVDGAVDGMPDAPPVQLTWQVIDTLTVPVNGTQVVSSVTLANGVMYRLRAEGTFIIQSTPGTPADAEWWDYNGTIQDGVTGVDVGLAVDDSVVDTNRTPKWGAYQASHVYEVNWVGDGTTIFAMLHDGNFSNNTGSLTLRILALQ